MRLDLRPILRTPGASLPFRFELDLSGLDFYGEKPFAHPVRASGTVRNMAGALQLEGTAETTLELTCDRCLKPFARELALPVTDSGLYLPCGATCRWETLPAPQRRFPSAGSHLRLMAKMSTSDGRSFSSKSRVLFDEGEENDRLPVCRFPSPPGGEDVHL